MIRVYARHGQIIVDTMYCVTRVYARQGKTTFDIFMYYVIPVFARHGKSTVDTFYVFCDTSLC